MPIYASRLDILPAEQRQLWPELRPIQHQGYVLYGGTAIALRLGHRQSIDFDFFTSRPVNRKALRQALPFLRTAEVQQDSLNTFEIATRAGVKVAFYGGLDFGRTGEPAKTVDGVLMTASLEDLIATKLKVILQRSAAKDYQDLAALVRAGVRVDTGLAAAEQMFKPTFSPAESLRAMVYFEGGDLVRLNAEDRKILVQAAAAVKELPQVSIEPDLSAGLNLTASVEIETPQIRQDPRQGGPRMKL